MSLQRNTSLKSQSTKETKLEKTLRPQFFSDFPGQTSVKEKLKIFVQAAKLRKEPLDHSLFFGPPGLGKTTLAFILANEMGAKIQVTSGPALQKKGDLAAVLTGLKKGDILFIDEIHRLSKDLEEYLYSAMEDYYIDLIAGEGLGAQTMRFKVAPFTLIGATTRVGLLKAPFRDRFGIQERLSFYDAKSLNTIVKRSAKILKVDIDEEGSLEISRRSRGTPRVANRLLRRVRDFADVLNKGVVNKVTAFEALEKLGIDRLGLEPLDRKYLTSLRDFFSGGPTGVDTLSATLSEERDTLEETIEPFLLQEGLIQKTPRGRALTKVALEHIGPGDLTLKKKKSDQLSF